MQLPAFSPLMTFEDAARAVLVHLTEQVPMGLWAVTRVENGRQSYLYLDDNAYGLVEGGSHSWEASFCIHMAAGTAPPVAPDASLVPQYASAGVNSAVRIGAYAGSPIREADGTLFGAICGIDPEVNEDPRLRDAGPLLLLLGQLLSMVLVANRARQEAAAMATEHGLAAETDVLTGLYNRRAWERLLEEELSRFNQLGDPTVIAMTDLDFLKAVNDELGHAAGDDYIRRAGTALASSVRPGDVVARLGGDEFGLLLRHCDESAAQGRIDDLYLGMEEVGVASSVGWAPITILRGLPAALAEADEAMYAAKRSRRSGRVLSR